MGKVKPKLSSDSGKDITKGSLKTIVKPKDKLVNQSPVIKPVSVKQKSDFPERRPRPVVSALKRKQKGKKNKNVVSNTSDPETPQIHQKKHVKLAERKKKLALKFELMLKDQKEAQKLKKVERANKKIGSVATMGAIKDALPSLDSLLKFKGTEIKTGIPEYDDITTKGKEKKKNPSRKDKRKERKENSKSALKDKRIAQQTQDTAKRYDYLQKLMNDPTFRKNPRQVISEHIKNTKLEGENNS